MKIRLLYLEFKALQCKFMTRNPFLFLLFFQALPSAMICFCLFSYELWVLIDFLLQRKTQAQPHSHVRIQTQAHSHVRIQTQPHRHFRIQTQVRSHVRIQAQAYSHVRIQAQAHSHVRI